MQVDFATMTREQVDAEMETDIALETESIRTAEKYTSITKDTGIKIVCRRDLISGVLNYGKSATKSRIRQIILASLNYF